MVVVWRLPIVSPCTKVLVADLLESILLLLLLLLLVMEVSRALMQVVWVCDLLRNWLVLMLVVRAPSLLHSAVIGSCTTLLWGAAPVVQQARAPHRWPCARRQHQRRKRFHSHPLPTLERPPLDFHRFWPDAFLLTCG